MMTKRKYTKDVIQDEAVECGLACVSYIAQYNGKKLTLQQLRRQYEVTADGLSFFHLMKIFSDHQHIATGVKVDAKDLKEVATPAILLWNNCHFVVLKKVTSRYIEVMDPAVGSRTYTREEVQLFFSGVVLEVTVSSNFQPSDPSEWRKKEDKRHSFFSLANFRAGIAKYSAYIIPLTLLAILIQMTNVAIPKFMTLIFDEVLPNDDMDFLFLLIYIFSFVYFLQLITNYLKIILSQRLRRTISQFEGVEIVDRMLSMNLKFFSKRLPTDLLRKIKSVDVFHIIFTHGWIDILIESVFIVVFIALILLISFKLAVLTLLATSVMIFIRLLFISPLMSRQYSAIDAEIQRDNSLLATIDSIDKVKLNNSEPVKITDWFTYHSRLEDNRAGIEKIQSLLELSLTGISHIQTIVIMGYGAYSVLKGENTAGQLISFIFYKECLMDNIRSVVEKHVSLKLCSVEVNRLNDLIVENEEVALIEQAEYKSSALTVTEEFNTLEVRGLIFGYSNLDSPILRDISFHLDTGQKLVITGPSGCGKTTLLQIIAGMLSPTQGDIFINNVPLLQFGIKQYQSQIAQVSVNDRIMNGSVIENIIYESGHYDMALLEQCIEQSGLVDVIRHLSAGLNTRLGVNGARLSSGQMQRLLIARALYRRPRLLLLDEPTSHLDEQSAAIIVQLIKKLPVSCLIISHDQVLIKDVSNVFELQPITRG